MQRLKLSVLAMLTCFQPLAVRLLLAFILTLSVTVSAQEEGTVEAPPAATAPALPPLPGAAPAPAPTPAPTNDDLDIPLPPDASLAQLVADPLNFELLARFVLHAVTERNWGLLAAILGAALLAALRKFIPKTTVVGKWLESKLGLIVANFLLHLLGALTALFAGGGTFSWALVIKALSIAVTASGSWSIYKSVSEAIAESKAQKAGEAAAASPTSTLDK